MKNGKLPIGDYALEAIESQKVSELLASPALPFPEYQLSTLEDESVDDSFREGYAKGVHLADKLVEKEPQLLVAWHSLLTSNKKDFYDQLSELGFNEDDFGIKSEALTLSYFPRGADKPTFDSCALVLGFTQEIKRLNEQLLATTKPRNDFLAYCGIADFGQEPTPEQLAWFDNFFTVAVKLGLVSGYLVDSDTLDVVASTEHMRMVVVRCLEGLLLDSRSKALPEVTSGIHEKYLDRWKQLILRSESMFSSDISFFDESTLADLFPGDGMCTPFAVLNSLGNTLFISHTLPRVLPQFASTERSQTALLYYQGEQVRKFKKGLDKGKRLHEEYPFIHTFEDDNNPIYQFLMDYNDAGNLPEGDPLTEVEDLVTAIEVCDMGEVWEDVGVYDRIDKLLLIGNTVLKNARREAFVRMLEESLKTTMQDEDTLTPIKADLHEYAFNELGWGDLYKDKDSKFAQCDYKLVQKDLPFWLSEQDRLEANKRMLYYEKLKRFILRYEMLPEAEENLMEIACAMVMSGRT